MAFSHALTLPVGCDPKVALVIVWLTEKVQTRPRIPLLVPWRACVHGDPSHGGAEPLDNVLNLCFLERGANRERSSPLAAK